MAWHVEWMHLHFQKSKWMIKGCIPPCHSSPENHSCQPDWPCKTVGDFIPGCKDWDKNFAKNVEVCKYPDTNITQIPEKIPLNIKSNIECLVPQKCLLEPLMRNSQVLGTFHRPYSYGIGSYESAGIQCMSRAIRFWDILFVRIKSKSQDIFKDPSNRIKIGHVRCPLFSRCRTAFLSQGSKC